MAYRIRNQQGLLLAALIVVWNAFIRWFVLEKTTYPHADKLSTTTPSESAPTVAARLITAAAASNLATGITLAEAARAYLIEHFADVHAHVAADTTNALLIAYVTIPELTSASLQADLDELLNALKTASLAHNTQGGVHYTNDTTNLVTAANSTDLASSITLGNDIKAIVNVHTQFAPGNFLINKVAA